VLQDGSVTMAQEVLMAVTNAGFLKFDDLTGVHPPRRQLHRYTSKRGS
jgi:hypothetical protein